MGVDCDANANGKCRSWIDDELDALGEEGAHIPRPSGCCEEDARKQREAASMLRELRAVDRSVERCNIAANVVKIGAMDPRPEEGVEDDWALTDEDEDDDALRELKEARLRELKGAAALAAAEARRARYVEIKESALEETLRASSRVVVHVVLEGAEQCARIDEVCDELAPAFPKTKFVRIRPSVDSSTMRRYGVVALPAVLIFRRGKLAHVSCALEEFGGADDFDEERVTRWLAQRDVLPRHPFADKQSKAVDSDASSDDGEGSDDEVFGVNKPCEQCGRTYPHKHIRALRPGESMRQPGDSDDDDDDF